MDQNHPKEENSRCQDDPGQSMLLSELPAADKESDLKQAEGEELPHDLDDVLSSLKFGLYQIQVLTMVGGGYFAVCAEFMLFVFLSAPTKAEWRLAEYEFPWLPFSSGVAGIVDLFIYALSASLLLLGASLIFIELRYPSHLSHFVHSSSEVRDQPSTKASSKATIHDKSSKIVDTSSTNVDQQPKSKLKNQRKNLPVDARHSGRDPSVRSSHRGATPSAILDDEGEIGQSLRGKSFHKNKKRQQRPLREALNKRRPKRRNRDQKGGTKSQLDPPNVRYLTRTFIGRLGNVLFEFASAFCIAKLNNLTLALSNVMPLRDFQETGDYKVLRNRLSSSKTELHWVTTCCGFDSKVMTLQPRDSHHALKGFFQSWKYFEPCKAEVKQVTVFNNAIINRAVGKVRQLRKQLPLRTLVGIHVRMEDYLRANAEEFGRKIAPPEYYHRAMTYFRSKFRDVTFVVFTANARWFRANVSSASDVHMAGRSHSPALDMEVLSRMDHLIITVGTFGWWAAYKNNGTVVCYKDFYVPDSVYGQQLWNNATDFLYPGWIWM